MSDTRCNERFHLFPEERLKTVSVLGAFVGAGSGFYEGIKTGSLRYLTENGHRLPRTVGGWYFYHKKKNYVMIINGCKLASRQAAKYSLGAAAFFGMEMAVDNLRHGTIDFLNTTIASMIFAGLYGGIKQLSRVQTVGYIRRGGLLGLSVGITQDLLIWTRGGKIWYLDRMGIKNPQFQPSLQIQSSE